MAARTALGWQPSTLIGDMTALSNTMGVTPGIWGPGPPNSSAVRSDVVFNETAARFSTVGTLQVGTGEKGLSGLTVTGPSTFVGAVGANVVAIEALNAIGDATFGSSVTLANGANSSFTVNSLTTGINSVNGVTIASPVIVITSPLTSILGENITIGDGATGTTVVAGNIFQVNSTRVNWGAPTILPNTFEGAGSEPWKDIGSSLANGIILSKSATPQDATNLLSTRLCSQSVLLQNAGWLDDGSGPYRFITYCILPSVVTALGITGSTKIEAWVQSGANAVLGTAAYAFPTVFSVFIIPSAQITVAGEEPVPIPNAIYVVVDTWNQSDVDAENEASVSLLTFSITG